VKQIPYFILIVNMGLSLFACASNVATSVITYVVIKTMTFIVSQLVSLHVQL
jgi:hypothetical protein